MGVDKSRSRYQGLGMPDRRLDLPSSIWAAQTTAQEAGPEPGVPEPQQDGTALVVSTSGSMAATDQIDLRVIRGGVVGAGRGSWAWKRRADTDWYGWDHPGVVTNMAAIKWSNTGADHEQVDACTTQDGTVLVVASITVATKFQLKVYRRAIDASTWTGIVVASNLEIRPQAGIAVMPDQSIQIWHWVEDSGNTAQIRVQRSTDDGATWATTATGALDTPIDTSGSPGAGAAGYALGRIRAASDRGQSLVLAHLIANNTTPTHRSCLLQAAGVSNGEALTTIEITDGTAFYGFPAVTASGGIFYTAIHRGPANDEVTITPIVSAFTTITTATSFTGPNYGGFNIGFFDGSAKYQIGGIAEIIADDTGALYLLTQADNSAPASEGAVLISQSRDNGANWNALGTAPQPLSGTIDFSYFLNLDDAQTRINLAGAAWRAGQLMVAATHESSGTVLDESLVALAGGGHSTVTLPGLDLFAAFDRRGSWSDSWLPFDLADAMGWTKTTAGTAADSISTSEPKLTISTTSGTLTYDKRPPGAVDDGLQARFAVSASVTLPTVYAGFRLADGSEEYEVEIRIGAAGTSIFDVVGSATLATVSVLSAADNEWLIAMKDGKCTVARRGWDPAIDRDWTVEVDGATIARNTILPPADNRVIWGNDAATASSDWYEMHFTTGTAVGRTIAAGFTNPDDLIGRDWAPPPLAALISSGLRITAQRGPGRVGDEWQIDPRFRFGLASAFWSQSSAVRSGWRSTDTTAQEIALQLTTNGRPRDLSDAVLFTLIGINFSQFKIRGYNGTGWQLLATCDTRLNAGNVEISGDTIVAKPGAGGSFYVDSNEYAGSAVEVGSNVYRIVDHSAGVVADAGPARFAEFTLDGVDVATSTQTCQIRPRDVSVRIDLLGTHYSAWRIDIDAATTPEGYFEIGTLHVGRVEVFGTPPAFGWQTTTETNTEVLRNPDGSTRTRRRGPPARQYLQAWTDGVWMGQHDNGIGSPDYLDLNASGSAEPSGTKHDTAAQVEGLLREVDGPDRPVVVLRTVDQLDGSTVEIYNRRAEFMIARLGGDVTVENVRGPEYSSELVRIAQLVADELV